MKSKFKNAKIHILWIASIFILTFFATRLTRAELEEDRVAFVIGNANYSGPAKLENPTNDSTAVSEELKRLGFETYLFQNLKVEDVPVLNKKLQERLKRNTRFVFYYAGHGIQIESKNYLLPINASFNNAEILANQSLYLGDILKTIERAKPRLSVVVLDACRDNPFGIDKSQPLNKNGLARVDPPSSTVIFYATRPGGTASDGYEKNGLFTQSLLTELKKTEVTLEVIFRRVSTSVYSSSKGDQEPWIEGVIREEFVINHGKDHLPSDQKPFIQASVSQVHQVSEKDLMNHELSISKTQEAVSLASNNSDASIETSRSVTYAQALEVINNEIKIGKTESRSVYSCTTDRCIPYKSWSRTLTDDVNLQELKSKLKQVKEGAIVVCEFDLVRNKCLQTTLDFTVYNPFMMFMPKSEIRGVKIIDPQVSNSGGLIFKSDLLAGTGKSSVSCTEQESKLDFQNDRIDLILPRYSCFGVMPSTAKVTFEPILWDQEKSELIVNWSVNMFSWMAFGNASGIAKLTLPTKS